MSAQNDEVSSLKEWYRYDSYVRKKYLAALEKLPSEELGRDRGASFPAFLDILAHILDAYRYWFFSNYGLKSQDVSNTRLRGKVKSVQELKDEERKIDLVLLNFVEGLESSEDLNKTFESSEN